MATDASVTCSKQGDLLDRLLLALALDGLDHSMSKYVGDVTLGDPVESTVGDLPQVIRLLKRLGLHFNVLNKKGINVSRGQTESQDTVLNIHLKLAHQNL